MIESDCMQLVASGHATDSDLRTIVAVLGIGTELERMGDYAEGIANIALMMGEEPGLGPPVEIRQMAQKGIEMLRDSLEAFAAGDVDEAKRICHEDDEVDGLYDQAFRELLLFIIAHPEAVTQATRMIWAAHNLERFADRVTNICERVVFSATGQFFDIGASRY
jgi:phosphate transport system protein